jgi:hypothetical protein
MIPKNVSASSAVDHENKGEGMSGSTWFPASEQPAPAPPEATDGLRTERVTLEITHKSPTSAAEFLPRRLWWDRSGESVRVVEEAVGSVDDRGYADRMGCDEERDFANRILDQRDAAIRERDALRARVAELEGCSWVPKAERDALQARVAELEATRITQALTADRFASAVAEADALRSRVDELEAAGVAVKAVGRE